MADEFEPSSPTSRRTTWGRWVIPAVIVFLLVATAGFLGLRGQIVGPAEDMRDGARGLSAPAADRAYFSDFRDTVWLPVRDMAAGGNPYDAPAYLDRHPYAYEFTYAPAQLVLFAPLAVLPLETAATVWFVLLVVGAVGLGWLAMAVTDLPRRADLLLVLGAAILLTRPMVLMIVFGQTSMVAILGTTVALVRRRPDLVTAIGLAGAWLKPQFGLPVAVLLLVVGARRAVWIGTALAAAVSLPAVVWLSINSGGVPAFISSLPVALDAALHSPTTRPTNGTVTPDLAGLIAHVTGADGSSIPLVASFALVLSIGAWALRRGTANGGPLVHPAVGAGLTTVLLCLPHFSYDLVLLVPVVAAIGQGVHDSAGRRLRVIAVAAALLATLPLVMVTAPTTRGVQLTLLTLLVGGAITYDLMHGRRPSRLLWIAVSGMVLLLVRYGLGWVLADSITSGLNAAVLLLVVWLLLVLAVLMHGSSRSRTPTISSSTAGLT